MHALAIISITLYLRLLENKMWGLWQYPVSNLGITIYSTLPLLSRFQATASLMLYANYLFKLGGKDKD